MFNAIASLARRAAGVGIATAAVLLSGCAGAQNPESPAPPFATVAVSDAKPIPEEPSDAAIADLSRSLDDCLEAERAEPSDASLRNLGLADCVALALRRNRRTMAAAYAAERQREEIVAAWREILNPRAQAAYATGSGEAPDTHNGKAGLTWKYAGFVLEPFVRYAATQGDTNDVYTGNIGIALSRSIFRPHDAISQRLPITRARHAFLTALNLRMLELRQLRVSVTRAFYAVLNADKRVQLRENRETDAAAFLANVQARVTNGFAAPIEETYARISLNQASADLIRERTELQGTRETLLDILGLDLQTPFSLRPDASGGDATNAPSDASELAAERDLDIERDLERVLASHENVLNKRLDIALFDRERLVRRDNRFPELTARATAAQNQKGDGFFSSAGGDSDSELTLGIDFSMPLDLFSAERARVRQDEWRTRELQLELTNVRRDLERELRARFRDIQRWGQTVQLARERLEAERRKLDATFKRYEAGGVDNLEVTRAKQSLDDAEVSLLDARVSRILALADYAALIPADAETDGK